MATVVETFYVEETVNLIHDGDALQRWNEKVAELGLVGQKEVVKVEKSPIPFLWMNNALSNTFSVLCPTKVKIQQYDKTPIPLELLEVVGLCKNEEYFDCIKVWYNEVDKDPVIVGYKIEKDSPYAGQDWYYDSCGSKYLIGRWADVKASIDSLIERAKKIFFASETLRLKKEIREKQREIEDLESSVSEKFGNAMPITDGLTF